MKLTEQQKSPIVKVAAITICQPHAWAILEGIKRYENRTWASRFRGPVYIHAGKSKKWLKGGSYPGQPADKDLIFGAIIGVVDMVNCLKLSDVPAEAKYAFGPYCHEYVNPRPLKTPVHCMGALGYWALGADVQSKITLGGLAA